MQQMLLTLHSSLKGRGLVSQNRSVLKKDRLKHGFLPFAKARVGELIPHCLSFSLFEHITQCLLSHPTCGTQSMQLPPVVFQTLLQKSTRDSLRSFVCQAKGKACQERNRNSRFRLQFVDRPFSLVEVMRSFTSCKMSRQDDCMH